MQAGDTVDSLLQVLKDEQGELSLEYLRDMGDDEAKAELMRFKGVGPKTVACVLMFSLARAEFPVDAHVVRMCRVHSHGKQRLCSCLLGLC